MIQVNVYEAKTHLSKLLKLMEDGEEIVIARNGTPVAKLVRHVPERNYASIRGIWKGKADMSRFYEADEEIAREFGTLD